ncbi:hypothetical protein QJQ45_022472, partial [Haematococcus lacustris]
APTSTRRARPAWNQQRDQPVRGLMWSPVVAPRKPPQVPCSSQEATPAAASEPGPSTPLPAKCSKPTKAEQAAEPTQPTKGKGKAAKAKSAPQPGRWLDRDCNAALKMQCIGESRWRPLELCWWPEQGKLPAKGKEYPGLGYKRLRDKPPKAQQSSSSSLLWHSSLVSDPEHLSSRSSQHDFNYPECRFGEQDQWRLWRPSSSLSCYSYSGDGSRTLCGTGTGRVLRPQTASLLRQLVAAGPPAAKRQLVAAKGESSCG